MKRIDPQTLREHRGGIRELMFREDPRELAPVVDVVDDVHVEANEAIPDATRHPVAQPEDVQPEPEPPPAQPQPVAQQQPEPPPEPQTALGHDPAWVREQLGLHYHIPTQDETEQHFIDHELNKDPGYSIVDWARIAPYIIEADPEFTLERLKGWSVHDEIADAVRKLRASATEEAIRSEGDDA